MNGTIHNRDQFLTNIASKLGRERLTTVPKPTWQYGPQHQVLAGLSQDELLEVLIEQCKNIHTNILVTHSNTLPTVVNDVVKSYGAGSVVAWQDERFQTFGLDTLMDKQWPSENIQLHYWHEEAGVDNIRLAEQAKVGMTISEMTLAESGTAVLYSGKHRGRSVSFLPENSIILIPKSTIVPRMTQAAKKIHDAIENGEQVASCVNFITGPSNSADIEMILVVGVHGPVKMTYIVIEDQ
ncbi:lactate utilization protein C [Lysinibacillus sp. KU-BSD001]|uniref:LutC/YkgG family protein n=1 Tax=Lysinibacillus sp. KU-BSD001 TaxID=3141328 RepID=UPI0036EEFCC3